MKRLVLADVVIRPVVGLAVTLQRRHTHLRYIDRV